MNKLLIKVLMSLLFIYSSLTANEMRLNPDKNEGWYIGFGKMINGVINHHDRKIYADNTTDTENVKVKVSSEVSQFKVGYDTGELRAEILYTANKIESGAAFKGLDFDFAKTFVEYYNIRPFISLGGGMHIWDHASFEILDGTETRDRTAFSFNYGAGLIYRFEILEIELAYKGKYYIWENMTSSDETYETESNTNLRGLYVGANIRF